MPKADEQDPERDAKAAGQVELIVRAFHDRGIVVRPVFEHRGLAFMYETGAILVRDEYLRRVEEIVGLDGETGEPARDEGEPDAESEADDSTRERGPRVQRVIRGVVRLSLAGTPFGGEGAGVLAALDEIDAELGTGAATPNQVLTVSGVVHPCPATEPAEVPEGIEPYPGVCPGQDGGGVRVYLADTGLLAGAPEQHSWRSGAAGGSGRYPAVYRTRDVRGRRAAVHGPGGGDLRRGCLQYRGQRARIAGGPEAQRRP
jgi:hypothetical protein